MNKSFEIADIIAAFIKGEATSEQLVRLEEWQRKSDENKRLFLSIMDEANFKRQVQIRNELNIEGAFRKVKDVKDVSLNRQLWKISIAASIAIIVVLSVMIFYNRNVSDSEYSIDEKYISGGSNRAYLTTSTGVKVELNKQDTLLHGHQALIRIDEIQGISYQAIDDIVSTESAYNTIEIPERAEYKLMLSDGTKVWLNAGSKLRFPEKFIGNDRKVELIGEAYFDVVHDDTAPFIVQTSRSVVTVLGTEFNIRDYEGAANLTTLVQGRVIVNDFTNNLYEMEPGQQVIIDSQGTRVVNVETLYFTSWKDGYFVFNEMTIVEIMEELTKWYDFDCYFSNDIEKIRLTARLKKYDDINTVLDLLSYTGEIKFSQKGRIITVEKNEL